jgi:hypothetical protein
MTRKNLRSTVLGGPTFTTHICPLDDGPKTPIDNLHNILTVSFSDQNILGLDIAMGYLVAVNVVESFEDFSDNLSRNMLRYSVFVNDFIKKFNSLEELSDDQPFLWGLEVLENV